jgi:uncharacterized protein (DUF433 family)|tara:strand:- start:22702 stop:23568 length:867 start_codon:yes stop_codon:yes gene_type:complete
MRNGLRVGLVPAIGALALCGAGVQAGDDCVLLTNPGFEDVNPGFPDLPIGWNGINMTSDDYVDINDPGAEVRSGQKSIRLTPAAGDADRFKGWTTNLFRPDGSDLYDPDYEYLGGDVTVSGYYLVPEGQVLQDTIVGVKLEFRREPPNFSIYTAFEFSFPDASTGGFWMPFSFEVTDDMMAAVGDFPPYPTSVSVLPFRFFGGQFGPGTSPTGTVFIDDLCIVQDMGGPGCSPADVAEPFGTLNFFDVSTFISMYNAGDPDADLAAPFGSFNFFDVAAFISLYNDGCP